MASISLRTRVAVASVVSGVLVLASCGVFSDQQVSGSHRMLDEFGAALAAQDAGRAAALTSAPGQAAPQIASTLSGMHAQSVKVSVTRPVEYSDGTADYGLDYTWDLGSGRSYTTQTTGTARKLSSGWRVQWDPTVLAPGLQTGGALRLVRTDATPAPAVLDTARKPWMTPQGLTAVVIDPSATRDRAASVRRLAAVIAPIAPLITAPVIEQRIDAAGGKPTTVVSLRDSDMAVLAGNPAAVPGVTVTRNVTLLTTDRRISSPLAESTAAYWQALRDATSGWAVQRVAADGGITRLAGEQGPPAPSFSTTINPPVQLTVNASVVDVAQPATMLVLDARSGAILAAADNDAADAAGAGLDDLVTPGSTLDPVLGAIDAAAGGNRNAAEKSLHSLGLGVDYTVPGVTAANTGRAGISAAGLDSAPQVSALSMGALGVAIARMAGVAPSFVRGTTSTVRGGELGPVDPTVGARIAAAMRSTATTGDASDLTGASDLRALVGTNGPQGPGWFVGITRGQVVVVHCAGEKSGSAALQVVQKYLRQR
ncbi:NTF2-like N-terminal transpeptidase domain-containing protein [Williamsia deligens]|uniref:NTF2-like N-terminal transpeptidase domain-containing protein n=1 Tax=Williamsia deligens TaxID=321325 RepID=A0ABW3G834_9NOCA|nr:NTF2-like N-terminal transpeptidase domain-containing protein [Williamsia deligens]MCP2194036.1 NTF2-like N-terminal transpeptidase domain-containing protein [Williamsia deligens]